MNPKIFRILLVLMGQMFLLSSINLWGLGVSSGVQRGKIFPAMQNKALELKQLTNREEVKGKKERENKEKIWINALDSKTYRIKYTQQKNKAEIKEVIVTDNSSKETKIFNGENIKIDIPEVTPEKLAKILEQKLFWIDDRNNKIYVREKGLPGRGKDLLKELILRIKKEQKLSKKILRSVDLRHSECGQKRKNHEAAYKKRSFLYGLFLELHSLHCRYSHRYPRDYKLGYVDRTFDRNSINDKNKKIISEATKNYEFYVEIKKIITEKYALKRKELKTNIINKLSNRKKIKLLEKEEKELLEKIEMCYSVDHMMGVVLLTNNMPLIIGTLKQGHLRNYFIPWLVNSKNVVNRKEFIENPEVIDAFIQIFLDKQDSLRHQISYHLSNVKDIKVNDLELVNKLIKVCGDGGFNIEKAANNCIEQLIPWLANQKTKEAVDLLIKIATAYGVVQSSVRNLAVIKLGDISQQNVVECLIGILACDQTFIKESAIEALRKLKYKIAIKPLLKVCTDQNVRSSAVFCLGNFKDEEIIKFLINSLQFDEQPIIRKSAAQALGKMKNKRATDLLINVLLNEKENMMVKCAVAEALGEIGEKRIVPVLLNCLIRYKDFPYVKYSILRAFGNMKDKTTVDTLIQEFLKYSANNDIAGAVIALDSLVRIDDKRAVEPLMSFLKSRVSQNCFFSLERSVIKALADLKSVRAIGLLLDILEMIPLHLRNLSENSGKLRGLLSDVEYLQIQETTFRYEVNYSSLERLKSSLNGLQSRGYIPKELGSVIIRLCSFTYHEERSKAQSECEKISKLIREKIQRLPAVENIKSRINQAGQILNNQTKECNQTTIALHKALEQLKKQPQRVISFDVQSIPEQPIQLSSTEVISSELSKNYEYPSLGSSKKIDLKKENANGDDRNLHTHGKNRTYWYSMADGMRLLINVRRNKLNYIKNKGEPYSIKAGEEEYSSNRENRNRIFIADQYHIENFIDSLNDNIKGITGTHEEININHAWTQMPETLIFSFLSGLHWSSIRVQINYATGVADVLWDNPYGTGFDKKVKHKILEGLKENIASLINRHRYLTNSENSEIIKKEEVKIIERIKKIDQQGQGRNGWDCGPITFGNINDYAKPNITNEQFEGNNPPYTISSANNPNHEDQLINIRTQDILTFRQVASILSDKNEKTIRNQIIESKKKDIVKGFLLEFLYKRYLLKDDIEQKISGLTPELIDKIFQIIENNRFLTAIKEDIGKPYIRSELEAAYNLVVPEIKKENNLIIKDDDIESEGEESDEENVFLPKSDSTESITEADERVIDANQEKEINKRINAWYLNRSKYKLTGDQEEILEEFNEALEREIHTLLIGIKAVASGEAQQKQNISDTIGGYCLSLLPVIGSLSEKIYKGFKRKNRRELCEKIANRIPWNDMEGLIEGYVARVTGYYQAVIVKDGEILPTSKLKKYFIRKSNNESESTIQKTKGQLEKFFEVVDNLKTKVIGKSIAEPKQKIKKLTENRNRLMAIIIANFLAELESEKLDYKENKNISVHELAKLLAKSIITLDDLEIRINKEEKFDEINCWTLARFSNLVYEPEEKIKEMIRYWFGKEKTEDLGICKIYKSKHKKPELLIRGNKDTQALIIGDEKNIIIAFRGTDNIENYVSDVLMSSKKGTYGKEVHRGFWELCNKIWPKMREDLSNYLAKFKLDSKPEVWFTGHSLGGAIAVLAACDNYIKGNKHIYTYGQPKCGDIKEEMKDDENIKEYNRIVNHLDPVTVLPPGYKHAGDVYYFNERERLMSEKEYQDLKKAGREDILGKMVKENTIGGTINGLVYLGDHSMVNYLAKARAGVKKKCKEQVESREKEEKRAREKFKRKIKKEGIVPGRDRVSKSVLMEDKQAEEDKHKQIEEDKQTENERQRNSWYDWWNSQCTISIVFPAITPKAVSDIMFGKESTTTKPIKIMELKPIKIGNKKDITFNFKMVPWDKKNNLPGQSSNFRFKQTGAKEFDLLIEENFYKNYKNTLMYKVYEKVEFRKMEESVLLGKLPPSFDKPEDLTNETKTKGKAEFDSPSMVEALFEVCRIDKDFEALISQIEDYFAVADTWEKLTFVGANDQVQTTIDLDKIEEIKKILEQKKDLFIGMIRGVQQEFNSRSLVGAEKIDAKAIDEISKQETYDRFLKIYS